MSPNTRAVFERIGMQKPPCFRTKCAAFKILMREKTARGVAILFCLLVSCENLRLRRFWLIVDGAPNFHEKAGAVKISDGNWVGGAG